ncbi:hypothetical protein BD414DRAFT_45287 [Trametes punicea]|nr:hypothetical protein BD414DRAFT_45287 [Trametes punicea]
MSTEFACSGLSSRPLQEEPHFKLDASETGFTFSSSFSLSSGLYLSALGDGTRVSDQRLVSGGSITPLPSAVPIVPAQGGSSRMLVPSPPQTQPSGAAQSNAPSTFLPHSRSLLSPPTLLSDSNVPSLIALKGAAGLGDVGNSQTPSPPPLEPTPRGSRPSCDSTRSTSSNRSVTVQRLALNLPLSTSGSLSALIHALEDAAPGWYQSLMETVIPQELSESPLSTFIPPSAATRSEEDPHYQLSLSSGLSAEMLASLDALEAIAVQVRHLPVPRLRAEVFTDVDTPFFHLTTVAESRTGSSRTQLVSYDSTPHEEQVRQPGLRRSLSPGQAEQTPRAPSRSSRRTSYDPDPPLKLAVSNIVSHPKLTKTLGLSPPALSRLPAVATPAKDRREGVHAGPEDESPHVVEKKASSRSLKAPKTPKALKSIFRHGPKAPPVPALPDYDENDSPVRKAPLKFRFSEASALRREDCRTDSGMSMRRHFSSDTAAGRRVDSDSFLFL